MVTITGHSDDLIEIEGDIVEEFSHMPDSDNEETYLAFSDGTVLSVAYTNSGLWRINRVKTGQASYEKEEATGPDATYTDKVTLGGPSAQNIYWVVQGKFAEAS